MTSPAEQVVIDQPIEMFEVVILTNVELDDGEMKGIYLTVNGAMSSRRDAMTEDEKQAGTPLIAAVHKTGRVIPMDGLRTGDFAKAYSEGIAASNVNQIEERIDAHRIKRALEYLNATAVGSTTQLDMKRRLQIILSGELGD